MKWLVEGPLTRLAIAVGHVALLLLGSTWRIRHVNGAPVDAAHAGGSAALYVFTHGVILPLAFSHRGRGILVLISRSRDGEIISRVVGKLGFSSARGSSTRGGGEAMRELEAAARAGRDLAVTPDGPRGPRGSVAPGAARVAAATGIPIVPVGVSASRAWRARSWDRFLVPKPGARVWVTYGEPFRVEVPDDAARDRIARGMEAVEARAVDCATGRESPPDARKEPA